MVSDAIPADDLKRCDTPDWAISQLKTLYDGAIKTAAQQFDAYTNKRLEKGAHPPVYPYLLVKIPAERSSQTSSLALGQVASDQDYGLTVTQPGLFGQYLLEQLSRLRAEFGAHIYVGRSKTAIPLSFALEHAAAALTPELRDRLQFFFNAPNLVATNDDVVDGHLVLNRDGPLPLGLFPAERTDYSLHRIQHYTATAPKHFQKFILFTNYQRYVDEFVAHAHKEIAQGRASTLVEPGNRVSDANGPSDSAPLPKLPQMPAYHLVKNQHDGVTLVNIGVGPSNAKTITDHLAVLRPHVWLMIGHCGGLRKTQRLGDYVLAHAYLRDDNVLDDALDPTIPLPTIAEVQLALTRAVQEVTDIPVNRVKEHLRTGTIVTTGDRNWELRFNEIAVRLNQSRAIAIDMESATIAANGYRYRVPYGTLLCVSDRPLHGELKLPGMADAFYESRVSQHLAVGLRAVDLLRAEAEAGTLHSRKLRSFDEPFLR
ncbi:MAG: AMP nucleosidase [Parvularculaceae bacterium]|nr:MAG: AMP nucleosidase [Parvularculaceae bacterium]